MDHSTAFVLPFVLSSHRSPAESMKSLRAPRKEVPTSPKADQPAKTDVEGGFAQCGEWRLFLHSAFFLMHCKPSKLKYHRSNGIVRRGKPFSSAIPRKIHSMEDLSWISATLGFWIRCRVDKSTHATICEVHPGPELLVDQIFGSQSAILTWQTAIDGAKSFGHCDLLVPLRFGYMSNQVGPFRCLLSRKSTIKLESWPGFKQAIRPMHQKHLAFSFLWIVTVNILVTCGRSVCANRGGIRQVPVIILIEPTDDLSSRDG